MHAHRLITLCLIVLKTVVSAGATDADAEERHLHSFKKVKLTASYFSEGATFGDVDGDGKTDAVYGPYWYEGPNFVKKHEFFAPREFPNNRGYSNHFFSFIHDINGDGRNDLLTFGLPGTPAHWYEQPEKANGVWTKRLAFSAVDNESPDFVDLTGDGRPEIVCSFGGKLGYVSYDPQSPDQTWRFQPISEQGSWHRFTHGLGVGDMDGDGKLDVLTSLGWWQQPKSLKGNPVWKSHPFPFSRRRGGGQVFAHDVDGDGDSDLITSIDGHGWGLRWYEQLDGGKFKPHVIMGESKADNAYGVKFSQLHALALADVDGDGLKDIVTGKCYWAHNGADPGARDPAVLYVFHLRRGENGPYYEPQRIDDDSGVGRQIAVADANGDGLADIIVGNKKGGHLFLQSRKTVDEKTWLAARPKLVHDALRPVARESKGWVARQKTLNENAAKGGAQVLFIGDSITQGWGGRGRKVWSEFYAKRNTLNLGIGGDRTQHVLWRLDHGNLRGLKPKVAVVMIGTNNSGDNSSEEIAEGVTAIVEKLRYRLPRTKVLLLGVFPRGETKDDKRRQVNEGANRLIAKLAKPPMITYQDIGERFTEDDGRLTREIMPDLLHLSEKGYRIWAESIEPTLEKLMK